MKRKNIVLTMVLIHISIIACAVQPSTSWSGIAKKAGIFPINDYHVNMVYIVNNSPLPYQYRITFVHPSLGGYTCVQGLYFTHTDRNGAKWYTSEEIGSPDSEPDCINAHVTLKWVPQTMLVKKHYEYAYYRNNGLAISATGNLYDNSRLGATPP